jgi:esterase/lipase superfamily enzyme
MSNQGITGLVYLNAGVTLLANRFNLSSPEQLVGKKIGVYSASQEMLFRQIGAAPLISSPKEARGALGQGVIDSVEINSTNPASWVLPSGGSLLTDSVKAQVAVVVTHDKSWNEIPFVYRALISDAAIATAQAIDRNLIDAERLLFERAQSAGVSLAGFSSAAASRATQQWISEQPEPLRSTYTSVYDYVKSAVPKGPQAPINSGRRGDVGTLYFATTRDDTGNSNFSLRFGDARTDVVKCGQIQFFQRDLSTTSASFVGSVIANTDRCDASLVTIFKSSKRMLLFVHGFNNRFSDAVERAIVLKNKLGNDTEVVLWSWPSKRDGLAGNYDYDKESVTGVAQRRLVGLLRALRDASTKPLSILAHSMGGWHVLGALQALSDDNSPMKLGNLVLAAPDIPDDEFNFALPVLDSITSRITLYACGWDWALILSEQINAYPRAGTGGNNIVVHQGMDSIDVNATFSVNHSYVFDSPKVLGDLSNVILTGVDPNVAPRDLVKVPKAPWLYWRFHQ